MSYLTLNRKQKKIDYVYTPHTNTDIERAYDVGQFPSKPSDLFLKVYSDVMRTVKEHPRTSVASPEYITSHGMVPLSINAVPETLFSYYKDCIVQADTEILIAVALWQPGKMTEIIGSALRELNDRLAHDSGGRKVVVKILWGRGGFLSHTKRNRDKLAYLGIPSSQEAPYLDIEVMNCHKPTFGMYHVKFMIVDRQILLLTSANIEDKATNIELLLHMEGKIVDSFYDTFVHMWHKDFVPPLPLANARAPAKSDNDFSQGTVRAPCTFHSTHAAVPMFLAHRRAIRGFGLKRWVTPQNVGWLSAMHHAKHKIFIETPELNEKMAINGVLEACKRGVQVTVVLSSIAGKDQLLGGSNVRVMKGLYKELDRVEKTQMLTTCFYVAEDQDCPTKVHDNYTKFMAVDDTVAIVGSGNMNAQSWKRSQEVNVVIDSPSYVSESLDLFRISQCTHLYGVVNPLLPTHPVQQIDEMLMKANARPTPSNIGSAMQ